MRNSNLLRNSIFAAIGMLVLIIDCKTAFNGASEGVSICIESVIPSLFPMLLLSIYLNSRLSKLNLHILSPITAPVGIPKGYEGILLIGWLGGYPVGAQAISQSYKNREINKATAQRLLTFCSNAGPSFIFGVVSVLFDDIRYVWLLWIIQILSSYITGLILSDNATVEYKNVESASPQTAVSACKSAVSVLAIICAWVIFFRVLINFIDLWALWLLPDWVQILISGILELTNGCLALSTIEPESLRFMISSVLLNLGGICVLMQTSSVIEPLSPSSYILGKILQTAIAVIITGLVILSPIVGILIPVSICLLRVLRSVYKKTLAKSGKIVYNVNN